MPETCKALNLGDQFPNFQAETTIGKIDFYEWMGDSWAILFSHPSDYTPVCTTELARVATLLPAFAERNIKPIALSCDSVDSHKGWIEDIKSFAMHVVSNSWKNSYYFSRTLLVSDTSALIKLLGSFASGKNVGPIFSMYANKYIVLIRPIRGAAINIFYPIIADEKRELAVTLNMLDKDERDTSGIPLTCRAVFIIDSNKKLRLTLLYPATTGRNFNEILRVIDSLRLTDENKVATPADWEHGKECMVLPTVIQDEIPKLFLDGVRTVDVPSGKSYIRLTPQPNKRN